LKSSGFRVLLVATGLAAKQKMEDQRDLEQLMEDLKAFVLDEQNVVTYKWLSSTFSVSSDSAKRYQIRLTLICSKITQVLNSGCCIDLSMRIRMLICVLPT
jgi:transcription elongation factor GreA-like protein